MNVSPKLINLTEQIKKNAQSTHQLATSAETVGDTLISKALAEDMYHTGKHIPQNSSTYERPLAITSHRSELMLQRKMSEKIENGEMAQKLFSIRHEINGYIEELEQSTPELASKSWGFSVDENDRLVAIGDITDTEKQAIEKVLNSDPKVVSAAKDIPNIFIEGQEYDRGYDGLGKYWGKYDVTRENFSEIFDLKELLEKSYFGGVKSDGYLHVFNFAENLSAQVKGKAEVKYGY